MSSEGGSASGGKKTVVLAILDGWGIGRDDESNAIYRAQPETVRWIETHFPAGALKAGGISSGLPWNEEGNSEVGHMTLGAGRILYQHFLKINKAIETGEFFKNEALLGAFTHAKEKKTAVHLVGLLTDAIVHAAMPHLEALLKMAHDTHIPEIYLHLFTDGRDSPPKSAGTLLKKVEELTARYGGTLASLGGRFYGMDRDKHTERTEAAYRALVGKAEVMGAEEALKRAYEKGLSDEYVFPVSMGNGIKDGDAVIFFNFREDRMRQIAEPFVTAGKVYAVTMTNYYEGRLKERAAFTATIISETLGETLAKNGKVQLRVAETEKYAHVTYFFNGLQEKPFRGEYRVMIPSASVRSHAELPEMQAKTITDRVMVALGEGLYDFILCNYANPDMVAHTGDVAATVKAVQTVDAELSRLIRAVMDGGHTLIVTSDHGNAEVIFDLQTGQPDTRHNSNDVPLYVIGKEFEGRKLAEDPREVVGMLSDVAPTILTLMGIPVPKAMTGTPLLT